MTERDRQIKATEGDILVQEWSYMCEDGELFSAVAPSERGAYRVLNAERPGVNARYIGVKSA